MPVPYPILLGDDNRPVITRTVIVLVLFATFLYLEYTQFAGESQTNVLLSFSYPMIIIFVLFSGDPLDLLRALGFRNVLGSIRDGIFGAFIGFLLFNVATGFQYLGFLSYFPASVAQFYSSMPQTGLTLSVISSFWLVFYAIVAFSEESLVSFMSKDFSNYFSFYTRLGASSEFLSTIITRVLWMALHYIRYTLFGGAGLLPYVLGTFCGLVFSGISYINFRLVSRRGEVSLFKTRPLIFGPIMAHYIYDVMIQLKLNPISSSLIIPGMKSLLSSLAVVS